MICKCTACHHEWQQVGPNVRACDWCGSSGKHLANDYIETNWLEEIRFMVRKELLFSVTKSDCDWTYTRGSGPGGQKKNKTASAVHCVHRESGARGYAEDTRSQAKNRALAFRRMAETKEFKSWHRLESARRTGKLADINETVDRQMRDIRVEVKEGKIWVLEEDQHD